MSSTVARWSVGPPRAVRDRPGDLADEQRVPAGDLVHQPGFPGCCIWQLLGDFGQPEALQGKTFRRRRAEQLGHQARAGRLEVAHGRQHEHPHPAQLIGQMPQYQDRCLVGPVHVVEHHDQTVAPGHFLYDLDDVLEEPEAILGSFAREVRSALIPNDRRTCRHGQYAGAPSVSTHLPHATVAPAANAVPASSWASRVLPIPASPLHRTSRPVPLRAASSQLRNNSSSRSRPTIPSTPPRAGVLTRPASPAGAQTGRRIAEGATVPDGAENRGFSGTS